MDTFKLVLSMTVFGPKTDVYLNGQLMPDVLTLDAQPALSGGYTVTIGYFLGAEEVFHADAIEVDDSGMEP